MPMSLHSIKTLETRRIKRFPAKTFTNVGMVQRVIKNRVRAPTHPHWQQKFRYKEGVPCQAGNPQPLQVTIHRLQEILHTLHPGQHSQASRHFEAVVTIPTEVWEDEVHVVVTEVWENDVYVVLCCVTVWEDGVCAVLCCVAGVWEDDVVASPSPAGRKDASTAVRFSAAVFFGRCIRLHIYTNCFRDARFCLYCDVLANL